MLAIASAVPRTFTKVVIWIDMPENTLIICALAMLAIEPTDRHVIVVVLVQELALVAFFAESTQPVFANHGPWPSALRPRFRKLQRICRHLLLNHKFEVVIRNHGALSAPRQPPT